MVHQRRMIITDLGLAKELDGPSTSSSTIYGMPAFVEPQCFVKRNYKRNEKLDIYIFFGKLQVGIHHLNQILNLRLRIKYYAVIENLQLREHHQHILNYINVGIMILINDQ